MSISLVRPSKGTISSGWGWRSGFGSSFHRGIDFSWMRADRVQDWNIYAAAAGTVTFTGFYGGWGNLTRIDHGKGYSTWYAHQSKIGVRKGEKVHAGQKIGVKGNTGTSAGAHLHFELRLFGVQINPTGKFTATAGGDPETITEPENEDTMIRFKTNKAHYVAGVNDVETITKEEAVALTRATPGNTKFAKVTSAEATLVIQGVHRREARRLKRIAEAAGVDPQPIVDALLAESARMCAAETDAQ